MSWRVVVVSSNAKVDFKMDYLVVRTLDETRRVHISEIGVLMLESTAISITAYALCALLNRKVKVIFCDQQRNPCGELIPCSGSHDSTAKIRQQIAWSPAHKEAVWTEIIRAKIRNQRDVLIHWARPQAELLTQYLSQIQPGDMSNREGHAAKVYFNALFGMEFTRALSTPENAALNYGYGLILSAINREIAAAGYLSQIGTRIIQEYLGKLANLADYPVEYDHSENLPALLKTMDFRVDLGGLPACEALYEQLALLNRISKDQCYVLVNAKSYFNSDELAQLYQMTQYQKINMLMLENHASDPIYPFEDVLLFDSDMCELHLDSSDEIG